MSGDLRKFMPSPRTPEQKLLIEELGEGPGSRLLLLSLSGADAETLAAQSGALAAALSAHPDFEFVANGTDAGLDAVPDALRPYRAPAPMTSANLPHVAGSYARLGDQLCEFIGGFTRYAAYLNGLWEAIVKSGKK